MYYKYLTVLLVGQLIRFCLPNELTQFLSAHFFLSEYNFSFLCLTLISDYILSYFGIINDQCAAVTTTVSPITK